MHFTCPYCGNGSFTIASDGGGTPHATCNSCGKTTPFEKQQMTTTPESAGKSQAGKQKHG